MRVSDDFPVLHARSLHVVQETAPSALIARAADQAAFWTRATLAALVLSKLQFPSRAAQHGIAHARFPWAFTLGHYTPCDVAVITPTGFKFSSFSTTAISPQQCLAIISAASTTLCSGVQQAKSAIIMSLPCFKKLRIPF